MAGWNRCVLLVTLAISHQVVAQPSKTEAHTGATFSALQLDSPGATKRRRVSFQTTKAAPNQLVVLSGSLAIQGDLASLAFPVVKVTAGTTLDEANENSSKLTISPKVITTSGVKGQHVSAQRLQTSLEDLLKNSGLSITATVGAQGLSTDLVLSANMKRSDNVKGAYISALDVVSFCVPQWPALPADPVGVGAKWHADEVFLVGKELEIKAAVSYELVAQNEKSTTIKATTKISSLNSVTRPGNLINGDVSAVSGDGVSLMTLVDGSALPWVESAWRVSFSLTSADKTATEIMLLTSTLKSAGQEMACNDGDIAACTSAAKVDQQRCDAGGMSACTDLAVHYFRGEGVPKNEKTAVTLNQKACDKGEAQACVNLGIAYSTGSGVKRNETTAADLFQRVCEAAPASPPPRENANGCYEYGLSLYRGHGVRESRTDALVMLRQACDGGVNDACRLLGDF